METQTMLAWAMPGGGEWILILLAILLLFGAKRIPDLARSLGRSLSEFKKGKEEGDKTDKLDQSEDGKTPGDDKGKA
jgi:sec-independent protein translocase protein TatA